MEPVILYTVVLLDSVCYFLLYRQSYTVASKMHDNRNIPFFIETGILSYQGLRLSNLTLGLTALIFSDCICHKPKIVTINMINHKAGQKSINTRPPDKTA